MSLCFAIYNIIIVYIYYYCTINYNDIIIINPIVTFKVRHVLLIIDHYSKNAIIKMF